ncbi:hypothetical protein AMS68_003838 [Peltaster fructicola]|uniref:MaoC-like domain-containing protein n=1 Tax=Peltaster fructicola TaxID=286661 RepID=A0A6H0XUH6_9PEZI|nr:hypothetical protein AMS68_003838 [Peltaster fructicola]
MLLAIFAVLLALGTALLYMLASSSKDPLDVNIPLAFAQLLLKYLPGYTSSLKIGSRDQGPDTFSFDTIQVTGRFSISDEDIRTFNKAGCGGSPFLLVAKTTPLVIKLLSDRRCPIKPLGAVNTRNVITFLQTDWHAGTLQKKDLTYIASFGTSDGIRRKRGIEFAITIDVLSGGQKFVQMELWMLQFLPTHHSLREPRLAGDSDARNIPGVHLSSINMTTQDPRRWAASCKDYNPIHISKLGARLFGFKSVIAHGNHVAALALQESGTPMRPFTLELEFVRPMLLPAKFEVLRDDQQQAEVLTVVSDERRKAHVRVAVKTLD